MSVAEQQNFKLLQMDVEQYQEAKLPLTEKSNIQKENKKVDVIF